jgi:hypothetical protein
MEASLRFLPDQWSSSASPPVVSNPYMLLAQIPPGTAYYSVLDLKGTFFCIPLHPKSQPIFAVEDPTWKTGQITWTILPQGFRDSPHLFRLALTQDLAQWQNPQAALVQYVDDLLHCGPPEPVISQATEHLLNFLADKGYKISNEILLFLVLYSSVLFLAVQNVLGRWSKF